MRVSQHFKLGYSQPELEFLDVDVSGDTRVFIDPLAFYGISSDWSEECVTQLESYFDEVIDSIRTGNNSRARGLLAMLGEPNETHLGLSKGRAQGKAMGPTLATRAWKSISLSRAITTGLLEDLEDAVLFVEGIGPDIVSDITTNVIRPQLIRFTQDACQYYGVPVRRCTSGRMWDRQKRQWYEEYTELPIVGIRRLLLVPKSIVRRSQSFDPDDYYTHQVIPVLRDQELNSGSSLVRTLKDGSKRVNRKDLVAKYGTGKVVNFRVTEDHPDILDQYRQNKRAANQPLSHSNISEITNTAPPDWEKLLSDVLSIPPGVAGADDYHRAVQALLTALFYPALDRPIREFKIHDGRKRIDIAYTNLASTGFFWWVHSIHAVPASYVFAECKNYGQELGNPELDQLSGRFSDRRGKLGLLINRGYGNKPRLVRRCKDTAADGRGYVLALDDSDLEQLVSERKGNSNLISFDYLHQRFDELI